MAEALHTNARNKLFFTVSPDDAKRLAGHVGPYLTADDLYRLDRYQAACRLIIDQRNSTGFTIATRPVPTLIEGRADQLRAAARAHGLPKADRERQAKRRRYQAVSGSLSGSLSDSFSKSLSALETDIEPDSRPTSSPPVKAAAERADRFPTDPFGSPGVSDES